MGRRRSDTLVRGDRHVERRVLFLERLNKVQDLGGQVDEMLEGEIGSYLQGLDSIHNAGDGEDKVIIIAMRFHSKWPGDVKEKVAELARLVKDKYSFLGDLQAYDLVVAAMIRAARIRIGTPVES